MRLRSVALSEICGLAADIAITCLLIFFLTVDPIAARFPGAVTGLATSWRLNRSMSGAPGAFPAAVTLISRIVSVGLFSLLQWRNPLIQPVVPLAFSALAALVLACCGHWRLQKLRRAKG